jgi:hypothetical protein
MMKPNKQNIVFIWITLSAALFLSVTIGLQLLGDKFLRGADAYYYALQALSWFDTGEVRIPDSNIIHRITGMFQYLGLNAETSLKLWISVSYFLFLSSFILLLKDFKSKLFAALIFAWAALSPSILFICIELPKTFLFLTFFNLAFYFLKKVKINFFILLPFLFICLLIHKMALLYIAVICVYLFIRNRFDSKKIFIALAAGLFFAAIYKFLIIDHFHAADILRLQSANFIPGVISLFLNAALLPAMKAEFVASAVFAVFLFYAPKSNLKNILLPLLLMLTAFIPAMGREPLSLGGRFGLLLPYLFILSSVYLLEAISTKTLKSFQLIFIYAVVIIAGFFHLDYSYPQNHRVKTYEEYEKLISQMRGKDIPMLVAHKNFHYYYKYKTGKEAFSYEPEKHWDKKRVWRLVHGITPEEIFFYMPEYSSWDDEYIRQFHGLYYALIREDCYFDIRKAVQEEKNQELYHTLWDNEINPSSPRPAFLYKKHKKDKESEFQAVF